MSPATVTPDTYRIGAAAKKLNVNRITVWRWVRDGKLPSFKIGSLTFIPGWAIEARAPPDPPITGVQGTLDIIAIQDGMILARDQEQRERIRLAAEKSQRLRDEKRAALMLSRGIVYVIGCGQYVKIGFTRGSVRRRAAAIQTGAPEPIVILREIQTEWQSERDLHERFADLRSSGEWFRREGALARWIDRGCQL